MIPSHLAELQAAWPGKWEPTDGDDSQLQLRVCDPAVYFGAWIDDAGQRWVCLDIAGKIGVLCGKGSTFASAKADLKLKLTSHVAPFNAALETLP